MGFCSACLLAAALAVLPLAAAAAAPGDSGALEGYEYHVESVRDMLLAALEEYEAGDAGEAFRLARDAYLLHFEPLEIPLRGVDPQFVLSMELKFSELRSLIRQGASVGEVEAKVVEIMDGMELVENYLDMMSNPAVATAAYSIVSLVSFMILFREGLEVILVLGVVYAYILATRSYWLKRHAALGVALGAAGVVATWFALGAAIALSGASRPLVEAATAVAALALLLWTGVSLFGRLSGGAREWMEFVRAKVWEAAARKGSLGILVLAATVVYRDGFEAVLLYRALFMAAPGFGEYIAAGIVASLGVLGAVAVLVYLAGAKLPFKAFATFTLALLAYVSVMLAGNAVEELQEMGYLRETPLPGLAERLSPTISDVTGIHPTLEAIAFQAVILALYAFLALRYYKALGAIAG